VNLIVCVFFFQAEDGIRDLTVTGVQTCALPIYFKTDGWPTMLMLVNAIGYVAEAAYHHPDLSVTWGRVIVKLQNHAAGGITDKRSEERRVGKECRSRWAPDH